MAIVGIFVKTQDRQLPFIFLHFFENALFQRADLTDCYFPTHFIS
jgi:hypothetical protein